MDNSQLLALKKDQIPTEAKTLSADDVAFLIETLNEKDDKLRYNAFLLLQAHSKSTNMVYNHWNKLAIKLDSDNSYHRSLGIMLLAENVRWDSEGKFAGVIDKYFACCNDEKFITARQTIQALAEVIKATDKYNKAISDGLAGLDFSKYKENQQSLLKRDVAATQKLLAKKG